jgi:hypothetical protein
MHKWSILLKEVDKEQYHVLDEELPTKFAGPDIHL